MTLPRLFLHLVWTTRDRAPLITAEVAQFLVRYLPKISEEEGVVLLAGGMVSTHIHLLVRATSTTNIPRLMQRLKGGSSRLADREHGGALRWAKGYSMTSVNPKELESVVRYLKSQPHRHPSEKIVGWESGFFCIRPLQRPPVAEPSL